MANNKSDFSKISSLEELKHKKRVLTSKIDHQEIMIQYQLRILREYISPGRLLMLGVQTASAKSPLLSSLFQSFNLIRSYLSNKK